MDMTFSSVLNTLFFSTIAILSLSYIIARMNIASKKGFLFISFFTIIIMLRLFLPFELPSQSNVNITKIWPDIYIAFFNLRITFMGIERSLLSILITISIVGSIVCAVKLLVSYIIIIHALKKYERVNADRINNLVIKINDEFKKNVQFRLLSSREITTPFLFGLRTPMIVLPKIELSEDEWYYILSHEISHYYHKDLWVRLVCELLQIIYWWNPLIYLLRKQVIKFQELHIDTTVTQKLDERQKLDYLQCLIKLAKLQPSQKEKWIAAFKNKNANEIQNRIEVMLHSTEKISAVKGYRFDNLLATGMLILCTLFLPNLIIFEPCAIPEEILEGAVTIHNANSYLILNEEGKYDVYVDNGYFGTVTQIFDESLKIMNSKGEVIK